MTKKSAIENETISGFTAIYQNQENMALKRIYKEALKLGEGPVWDYRIQKLFFVDIMDKKLYIYDYQIQSFEEHVFNEYVSCLALTPDLDIILISLESGLYELEWKTGRKTFITQPEHRSNYRYNDGAVSPWGTWLIGSMNNLNNGDNGPLLPDATLYELKQDKAKPLLDGVIISNGIVFEDTFIYFIDSELNSVRRFKYNDGKLEDETLVFQYDGTGSLDGMCLSRSQKLYIANWGANRIIIFDLARLEVIDYIPLPSKNPTSCTFGGPNMDELFISSSANEDDQPNAAGLYCLKIDDEAAVEFILNH